MIEKALKYFKSLIDELKKVRWLSREDTLRLTLEILIFSSIFVLIYGLVDSILVKLILSLK